MIDLALGRMAVMRYLGLLIFAVALMILAFGVRAQAAPNDCGLPGAIFCETFDQPHPGLGRGGDLDPNVWGVSRARGDGGHGNIWAPTQLVGCNGTSTVMTPHDVVVCNGQMRQALDDEHDVLMMAMYPKQPFDFAGRTGKIVFDVSNDTQGGHAAWPELWVSDTPVPVPFTHFDSSISSPRHAFGLRFDLIAEIGQGGNCPNTRLNTRRWGLGSAVVIRDYHVDDTFGFGERTSMQVQQLECVIASPGPNGPMNHIEVRVSQNLIEVWATDAGDATLRKIGVVTNPNLTLSRGLVWLEDAHYNAEKGSCPPQYNGNPVCQSEHTFAWDNLAFDGPFTYRDFSYDALDNNDDAGGGTVKLGKLSDVGQVSSWDVLGMPANPTPAAVRVLLLFWAWDPPGSLNITVNGHVHNVPGPFPPVGGQGFTWRSLPYTIPVSDLVPGTNVVKIGADVAIVTANVNIVLVNVPGGVPVLPGSNNAYPSGAVPTSTPLPTLTATPPATMTPPAAGYISSATAQPPSVAAGQSTTISAVVTSSFAQQVLVDVEIYAPDGAKIAQQAFDNEAFVAGVARTFTVPWTAPATPGSYTIKIGVFTPGWGTLLNWNDMAGVVAVSAASATATPAATSTPTPAIICYQALIVGQANPPTVVRGATVACP